MRSFLIWMITVYQKTLSLDHSPLARLVPHGLCRFRPTCSEYGKQAIEKYGVIKGARLTAIRILRCNPFTEGGEDPLH